MIRYTNFKTSLKYLVIPTFGVSPVWAESPRETCSRLNAMEKSRIQELLEEKGEIKERFFILWEDYDDMSNPDKRLDEETAKELRAQPRKTVFEVTYREYIENGVKIKYMNANDGQRGGMVFENRNIEFIERVVTEKKGWKFTTTNGKNETDSENSKNSCCRSFFHLLLLIGHIAVGFALIRNNGRLFKKLKARVLPVLNGDFSCTRTTEDFSSCDESSE